MLGLVDYSSEEEDNESLKICNAPAVKNSEPSMKNNSASKGRRKKSQSKKETKKKKKRVLRLAAVLPPEIQAILERGGLDDDDDDYEDHVVKTKRPKRTEREHSEDHALLALLPKPGQDDATEDLPLGNASKNKYMAFKPSSITNGQVSMTPPTEPLGGSDDEDHDAPGVTGIPEAEPEEENDTSFEHNDGADDDADEDKKAMGDNASQGEVGPSFFSLSDIQTPSIETPAESSHREEEYESSQHDDDDDDAVRAHHHATGVIPETTTLSSPSTMPQNIGDAISYQQLWQQQQLEHQQQQQQLEQQQQQQQLADESFHRMSAHSMQGQKGRRAREKELEKQIASGNFAVVDTMAQGVLVAPDTSTWNPHRHGHQEPKQKEIKIGALTYNSASGESQMVYQPSKTQKRKHQINSLAFTAAERELELMERRGQSMKTKAQTQAKYGW